MATATTSPDRPVGGGIREPDLSRRWGRRYPGVGPFDSAEDDSAWRRQRFTQGGGHVDAEYCLEHWEETPRQIYMQFWLCLEDWTEEKGALRVIPASHTLIAAANSALPEPPPSRGAGVHGKPTSPAGPGGQRATDVYCQALRPFS